MLDSIYHITVIAFLAWIRIFLKRLSLYTRNVVMDVIISALQNL